MLIREGYCKDMKSVFRRYFDRKKNQAVSRVEWKNIDEVVGWIHAAGGQAVTSTSFSLPNDSTLK